MLLTTDRRASGTRLYLRADFDLGDRCIATWDAWEPVLWGSQAGTPLVASRLF